MSYNYLETTTLSSASSYTYSDFNETSSSTAGTYWAWEFRFHDITNASSSDYQPQLQATASLNVPYGIIWHSFTSTSPRTDYGFNPTTPTWIPLTLRLSSYNVPSNGKLLIEQPKRNGTTWFSNFQFDWTTYHSTYGYSRFNTFGVFNDFTSIDEITLRPSAGTWSGDISVYGIVS